MMNKSAPTTVPFDQPLFIATYIEYDLDYSKFGGYDPDSVECEPALVPAPCPTPTGDDSATCCKGDYSITAYTTAQSYLDLQDFLDSAYTLHDSSSSLVDQMLLKGPPLVPIPARLPTPVMSSTPKRVIRTSTQHKRKAEDLSEMPSPITNKCACIDQVIDLFRHSWSKTCISQPSPVSFQPDDMQSYDERAY